MIAIQPDLNRSTAWAAEFITIAKCWETIINSMPGCSISGDIDPYALNFTVKVHQWGTNPIHIKVQKQMENIKSGPYDLKSFPYSETIQISTKLLFNNSLTFRALKRSSLAKIKMLLSQLKYRSKTSRYRIESNMAYGMHFLDHRFLAENHVQNLVCVRGHLFGTISGIPKTPEDIQRLIDGFLHLKQQIDTV